MRRLLTLTSPPAPLFIKGAFVGRLPGSRAESEASHSLPCLFSVSGGSNRSKGTKRKDNAPQPRPAEAIISSEYQISTVPHAAWREGQRPATERWGHVIPHQPSSTTLVRLPPGRAPNGCLSLVLRVHMLPAAHKHLLFYLLLTSCLTWKHRALPSIAHLLFLSLACSLACLLRFASPRLDPPVSKHPAGRRIKKQTVQM